MHNDFFQEQFERCFINLRSVVLLIINEKFHRNLILKIIIISKESAIKKSVLFGPHQKILNKSFSFDF